MKKIIISILIVMAIVGSILIMKPEKECVACDTWYTCDPPRCSQTVSYWDSWKECMEYSRAMGYPGCVCYGQDLK